MAQLVEQTAKRRADNAGHSAAGRAQLAEVTKAALEATADAAAMAEQRAERQAASEVSFGSTADLQLGAATTLAAGDAGLQFQ